ncbi:hypothetical protein EIP86_004823 [Pleurotus ostreatoroseus]|nr:hypothetical protein EIP86_004823 [Pleurotus ostreatoroseus]
MLSLLSFAYAIYTATRAELVGRQKSRAEDPRELEADLAKKRREHVEVEEGYRAASTANASLSAGCPYEVPPAGGRGPEPCDQAYEACAERQQYGDADMDFLTLQNPTPLSTIPEDEVLVQSEGLYGPETDDDLLCWFQADKRSIILHSLTPSITPHIIITPPPIARPGDYLEPDGIWENRLPVQWIGWHSVPPTQSQWTTYVPPSPWGPEGGWWYGGGYIPPPPSLSSFDTPHPPSAISEERPGTIDPAEFKRLVALAAQDHLVRYQAILPLYRSQYIAAACAASQAAQKFRERWDSEDVTRIIEKPYVWQDPAMPLLCHYGRNRGIATSIIESTTPFMTPHIVIEDAPPQPSWETDLNKVPYQDYSLLTILGTRCEAIDDLLECYDGDVEDSMSIEYVPFDMEEYDVGTDSDATLDSLELESPRDAGFGYASYPVDVSEEDEDEDAGVEVSVGKTYAPSYAFEPMDYGNEDEEDELPSLDDEFYQSTAHRYGIDLHTSAS